VQEWLNYGRNENWREARRHSDVEDDGYYLRAVGSVWVVGDQYLLVKTH
jgi:hypothetical protein